MADTHTHTWQLDARTLTPVLELFECMPFLAPLMAACTVGTAGTAEEGNEFLRILSQVLFNPFYFQLITPIHTYIHTFKYSCNSITHTHTHTHTPTLTLPLSLSPSHTHCCYNRSGISYSSSSVRTQQLSHPWWPATLRAKSLCISSKQKSPF